MEERGRGKGAEDAVKGVRETKAVLNSCGIVSSLRTLENKSAAAHCKKEFALRMLSEGRPTSLKRNSLTLMLFLVSYPLPPPTWEGVMHS